MAESLQMLMYLLEPEEFVAAGDFLTYKFPVWTWQKGDQAKARDYLPPEKQYLLTRGVPCLRRATSLAYTDADEDAERLVSFAEGGSKDKDDEWVETHAGRKAGDPSSAAGVIDDIPDLDGPASITGNMNTLNLNGGGPTSADDSGIIPDLDDIPDMEEENLEAEEDEATAKPATIVKEVEISKGNLLQVRTYDVMITYDKYYQTPRKGTPLIGSQVFQDVSADHALKTVTIEPFPHSSIQAASVHPCKHASVMKKIIEKMNAGVVEEQQRPRGKDGNKGKWLFRKVTGSGDDSKKTPDPDAVEGMRVDFYLIIFLKFIASIVPTIEVDSTTAF
ncbi:hypothetical protein Clacol_000625 [Clathrus columnatus]|uniref:Autophagy-related protein 3 n=1 Tax=Clathrus columnatus TaxID=1419009 RepID=A0AAV5A1C7_9AGAM|nr:hypothetical protein Clacol_000625 [Clathrus columnatus]